MAKHLLLCLSCVAVLGGQAAAQDMPVDVMRRVRASVEARYPDNYSMQKLLIDELNKLRSTQTNAKSARQIREGGDLAVQLAELLQRLGGTPRAL